MTANLTAPDPDFARLVRNTPPGMAYWAGTGPHGQTCKSCAHFGEIPSETRTGLVHRDRCALYQKQSDGHVGPKLPPNTPACKYFAK
jgi:hypothetical protein